ncbi:MAG: UDP-2,3-diacylglucosamine diphosphatase [Phycisphaeraceae bacterium]
MKLHYRTVFISDVHLGSRSCRARDLASFLKRIKCDRLYLVGDILDLWRLRQRWYWPAEHNDVIRQILRLAKKGAVVKLVPGNHDEAARQYFGLQFGGVRVVRHAVHETADGRRLLVTHGDQFDLIVTRAKLLSILGSWAYDWLVVGNVVANWVGARLGMHYVSLSQKIKLKVKSACTFIGAFEDTLSKEARRQGLDGVVCGHIHKAEARRNDVGLYYNCGDWVESCTALVEHDDGTMQVIDGIAFVEQLREQKRAMQEALHEAEAGEWGPINSPAGQSPSALRPTLACPSAP